ncbi:MAG: protein TolR [Rhodospirillales bacterium]|nr:protein TolR [Rhodospirillales bacterium]
MSDINVTPMIDVMLVLLVIFMMTAPLLTVGVQVDLPETSAAPVVGQDEPLAVSIDAGGQIFLQKTAVALEELAPRLAAISGGNPDLRIFVRGDKAIDYGRVMTVVGAINAAGFRKVALVTEVAGAKGGTTGGGAQTSGRGAGRGERAP